jgi:hypothetical protein
LLAMGVRAGRGDEGNVGGPDGAGMPRLRWVLSKGWGGREMRGLRKAVAALVPRCATAVQMPESCPGVQKWVAENGGRE